MTFGQVDLTISENTERKVRIRMPARSATIIDALRLNPTPSSGVFHHGTHHAFTWWLWEGGTYVLQEQLTSVRTMDSSLLSQRLELLEIFDRFRQHALNSLVA